jgi:hypothetical protein
MTAIYENNFSEIQSIFLSENSHLKPNVPSYMAVCSIQLKQSPKGNSWHDVASSDKRDLSLFFNLFIFLFLLEWWITGGMITDRGKPKCLVGNQPH